MIHKNKNYSWAQMVLIDGVYTFIWRQDDKPDKCILVKDKKVKEVSGKVREELAKLKEGKIK